MEKGSVKEGFKNIGKGIAKGFSGFYDFMSSDKVQNFGDNLDNAFSINNSIGGDKREKQEEKHFRSDDKH